MIHVLLIDRDREHALRLERAFDERGLATLHTANGRDAAEQLGRVGSTIDIVVLSIADCVQPFLETLCTLQRAAWLRGIQGCPLFTCIARQHLGAEMQLRIERMGVRYACEE